jgi:DNA-binding NarL/FixJ family response regulator
VINYADMLLTASQKEIVELIVNDSMSNREMAEKLGLHQNTIKDYLRKLYSKAGLTGSNKRKRIMLAIMFRPAQEPQFTCARLTKRERFVACMVSNGECNKEIGNQLGVTVEAVKAHVRRIFNKTGVWSRLELAAWVEAHRMQVEAHGQ